jgi:hypothetical protein
MTDKTVSTLRVVAGTGCVTVEDASGEVAITSEAGSVIRFLRPAEPQTARFLNIPLQNDIRLEPVVVGIPIGNGHSDAWYTLLSQEIKSASKSTS